MIGAYLIQLLANAGLTAAVVYIPLWAKNFNATHSQIGLLVALYQGMMFFSNLLCGRWADFGDRKRFVVFGLNLSAFALFLHLLPHSLFGLFSIRALTGICAGIFPAALVAYFYTENRNLGRFSGFGSLGWGIGAIMVGFLNNRHLFLTSGLLMLFTALLALHLLKKQPVTLKQSFFQHLGIQAQLARLSFLSPAPPRCLQYLDDISSLPCPPWGESTLGWTHLCH